MARRSLRSPRIDYTNGIYLVTIVTAHRRQVLGSIRHGTAVLSPIGRIVEATLLSAAEHADADVDELIVMPNHTHVIIAPFGPALGTVVGGVKSQVTRTSRLDGLWPDAAPLWHRGYHERQIRSAEELERARRYVRANPSKWRG